MQYGQIVYYRLCEHETDLPIFEATKEVIKASGLSLKMASNSGPYRYEGPLIIKHYYSLRKTK